MSSDEEQQVMYVDSFRPQAESRVSGYVDYGTLYGTEISGTEGNMRLAKQLMKAQRVNFAMDPLRRSRLTILTVCGRIISEQRFRPFESNFVFHESDTQVVIDRFDKLPNNVYKHPVLFIMGYIMQSVSLQTAMEVCKRLAFHWIREIDVTRYFRLHQSLPAR